MADIFGTQDANFIVGTVGDDTVQAFAGNDFVLGLSGRDLIFGNTGGDLIAGNGGADLILAGQGNDFVFGGRNDDTLFGDLGNDVLFGDLDNDLIIGSVGFDILLGGGGIDVLHGGAQNDIVRGGKNNDRLWGGRGDDLIFGDFGADILTGDLGFDTFVIGRRNDTNGFASTGGVTLADADTITDFTPGVDRIELIGGLTFDKLDRISDNGSTILRDRETGQYLAILQGVEQVNRQDFIPFTPAPTVPPANAEPDPEPTPAPELPAETEVLEDSNEAIDPPDSDTRDETNDNPNNDTQVEVTPTPVSPPAPPAATNQSPTVDADKTLTVLRGDDNLALALISPTDAEGDPLTITVTAVPDGDRGQILNGGTALAVNDTLTPEEIANLVFDPNDAGTPGTTAFSYTVSDGVNPTVAQTVTLQVATPGEIRGTQWNDLNGDGIRDIGEPGIVDRTVYLDLNNNDRLDAEEPSTTTDDAGGYVFTDLAPGTYTVAEVQERDWRTTAPGAIVEGSGTGGNVVVSHDRAIREYTQAGTPVTEAIAVPEIEDIFDDLRDLIVSSSGEIHTYNGTFDPLLSTYDPDTDTWTSTTYSGWSTVGNGSYGGIAIDSNYVYVTDMRTFGGGGDEAQGIVRFDLNNDTAIRFADTFGFMELTLGLDGLLYGLESNEDTIRVYDPQTLDLLWTTNLDDDVRGIAVDRDGDIFGASWDDNIYHFDNDGTRLNSIDSGSSSLSDLDISYDGQLVTVARFGDVIFTDTTLSSPRSFNVGDDVDFISFSTYQTPSRLTNPTHTVTVGVNEAIENIDFGNISLLEPVVEPD